MNEAALQLAKANLGYTTIFAPVDGTVVSRNFDEGQTVVASMSAQTLFTIATDLHTVLINASVPEADIGPVTIGQKVTFNVDAFPAVFTGTVDQVRIAASSVQNVVTYPVMVRDSNPDEKLFPGMTANISCIIAERTNVLRVSNTALRFRPEKKNKADKADKSGKADAAQPGNRNSDKKQTLHIQAPDGSLQSLRVTSGITDGTFTEIFDDNLTEGQEVITGVLESGTKATVVNPFMPAPPSQAKSPARK